MMKHGKRAAAYVLALVLMMLLCACGAGSAEEGEALTLHLAYGEAPSTLDPAFAATALEKTLISHIFENLMKPTANGVAMGMARSYTCTDNLDGTESYTFLLRSDVRWYNGAAVTAQDFVYAWHRLVSPEINSPNREILSVVEGYEQAVGGFPEALQVYAKDSTTLVVDLNCHCPYFVTSICTDAATMPVQRETEEQADSSPESVEYTSNGAYHVSVWQQSGDRHLLLTASPNYYDKKRSGPEKLDFLFADTAQQARQLYDAGEADFVMGPDTWEDDDNAVSVPLPESTFLIINQMAENLRQQPVRQAMSMVIDRNELAALNPSFVPAAGLVPEGVHTTGKEQKHFREVNGPLVDNDPEHTEENSKAAQTLLSEAHIPAGSLASMGTVTLLCQNTPLQQQIAGQVQKMWLEKLGLTAVIHNEDEEVFQEKLSQGEFSVAMVTVSSLSNDAWDYLKDFSTGKTRNYGLYSSTAYDLLMRTAAQSDSTEARDAYLEDAERLLLESGYVIPLYGQETAYLLRPELSGVLDSGLGLCYFHNVVAVEDKK